MNGPVQQRKKPRGAAGQKPKNSTAKTAANTAANTAPKNTANTAADAHRNITIPSNIIEIDDDDTPSLTHLQQAALGVKECPFSNGAQNGYVPPAGITNGQTHPYNTLAPNAPAFSMAPSHYQGEGVASHTSSISQVQIPHQMFRPMPMQASVALVQPQIQQDVVIIDDDEPTSARTTGPQVLEPQSGQTYAGSPPSHMTTAVADFSYIDGLEYNIENELGAEDGNVAQAQVSVT